jgi:DNA (cytosine-5)-methyltransferase 1
MPQDMDLFAGPRRLGRGNPGRWASRRWASRRDPAACATARAAGHRRLQADVTRWTRPRSGRCTGLLASPPCQGFSMAGKGRGREDAAHLLAALDR